MSVDRVILHGVPGESRPLIHPIRPYHGAHPLTFTLGMRQRQGLTVREVEVVFYYWRDDESGLPHYRTREVHRAVDGEPARPGCFRCVTPRKCAIYGCCPNTWPAETP